MFQTLRSALLQGKYAIVRVLSTGASLRIDAVTLNVAGDFTPENPNGLKRSEFIASHKLSVSDLLLNCRSLSFELLVE